MGEFKKHKRNNSEPEKIEKMLVLNSLKTKKIDNYLVINSKMLINKMLKFTEICFSKP